MVRSTERLSELKCLPNGFQERMFGMLATYDFLFPNVVGSLVNLPQTAKLDQAKVKAAVEAAPDNAAIFAKHASDRKQAKSNNPVVMTYANPVMQPSTAVVKDARGFLFLCFA